MVAWLNVGHITADLLDNATGFMPQNHGGHGWIQAFNKMKIAMTDASGGGSNQDLSWPGF